MKRTGILLSSVMLSVVLSSSLFLPSASFNISKFERSTEITPIPDNLKNVFKTSCYGCHSEGGNVLAMSKLNFSEWDEYSLKKQADKADKIYTKVSEGKMPPKKVRKEHPDLIPGQAQIDSILIWSKSLNEMLK